MEQVKFLMILLFLFTNFQQKLYACILVKEDLYGSYQYNFPGMNPEDFKDEFTGGADDLGVMAAVPLGMVLELREDGFTQYYDHALLLLRMGLITKEEYKPQRVVSGQGTWKLEGTSLKFKSLETEPNEEEEYHEFSLEIVSFEGTKSLEVQLYQEGETKDRVGATLERLSCF